MRIAVVCNDTRGGIQPYVALALGLRRAGHDVRAVAPSDLASMFRDVGLPVAPLSGSIEAVLRSSDGAAERGAIASMRLAARGSRTATHHSSLDEGDARRLRGRRSGDRRHRRNGDRPVCR